MSAELQDKLTQVEDDLRSLREDLADKNRRLEEAKETYTALGEGEDDGPAFEAAKEARREVGLIADQIEATKEKQVELLKLLGDREAASRVNGKPVVPPSQEVVEWSAEKLLSDPDLQARLEFISGTKSRFGSMEIGEIVSREMLAADIAPTSRQREATYQGLVPQILRPLRVLDLIPTGTTDGNVIPYTVESGPLTGALETAEGAAKPEAGVTYTDATAPVQTIAAWMKIRKQALADFAQLRTILDTRLRYLVQRRLEAQVLAGDGTGTNLTGILNTAGIGQVAYNANVSVTEHVLSGITNIYLADGVADGVVLHPADWNKALTEKAHFGGGAGAAGTAGSYEYIGGGPFGATPLSLWGVAAVPTPAMAAGFALVGDFSLGVTLFIREGVNVLMSDSDQDDFIKNRVTLLGEMRAGMPVWRPSVFQRVATA